MSGELHIGTLKNLNVLKFRWTKITKLNGDIAMLQNLKMMRTSLWLTEIPNDMDRLSNLEFLFIQCSSKGASVALPISLKYLITATSNIHILNLSDLTNLEELMLRNYEHPLPGDMWKLCMLKKLYLWTFDCESLMAVMDEEVGNGNGNGMNAPPTCCSSCLPSSLQLLDIRFSEKLKRLPNLVNLSNLTALEFWNIAVGEIIGLEGLRMLETLRIDEAPNLINLDGLQYLTLLKEIKLNNCSALERLPNLWNFTKLKKLEIVSCPSLSQCGISFEVGEPASSNSRITTTLPDFEENGGDFHQPLLPQEEPFLLHLSALHSLQELNISNCEQLTQVIGLDTLESLQELYIRDCESLRMLSNWSGLKNLKMLSITGCEQLAEEMMDLEKLESLENFELADHRSVKKLSLFGLEHLQELDISRCTQLTEISGLEGLQSLKDVSIRNCKSIEKLPDLSCLKNLQRLDISGCTQLTEVTGIENLKKLNYLIIDEILKIPPLESAVTIYWRS